MTHDSPRPALSRAPLIVTVLGGMAVGLYGGLLRLGVPLPAADHLADIHGPLMICGVFGTLISLERAVAIGTRSAFLAPVLLALGGLALVAGLPEPVSRSLLLCGAAAFVLATAWIMLQQRAIFTATLLVGAVSLLAGLAVWTITADVPAAVGAWLLFLVGTVAAERLELSRALVRSRLSVPGFLIAVGPLVIGAMLGITDQVGARIFGLGLVALTLWLVMNDVATTTVRMRGQPRFMASAMLAGYVWLPVAGLALLTAPDATFGYDLVLHAVLIGFVLSMVFGHALIIFPSVARIRLRYHPSLYLPLALLHLSVLTRVVGDALESTMLRTLSGPMTVLALLGFAAILVIVRKSSHR
jgi:hypothetical protein